MSKRKGVEIQIARGRLKGVLQDLAAPSDEEDELQDIPEIKNEYSHKSRQQKRGARNTPEPQTVHQSFIMKLFERSIDLAKYSENTGLYPICRAWIINQPRSASIKSLRDRRTPSPIERTQSFDLLDKFLNGTVSEITEMPRPLKKAGSPRVLPKKKIIDKDNIKLDLDIPKVQLMEEHLKHWKDVRMQNIQKREQEYERYATSIKLIKNLAP